MPSSNRGCRLEFNDVPLIMGGLMVVATPATAALIYTSRRRAKAAELILSYLRLNSTEYHLHTL